jgi:hypothetical protein
MQPGFLRVCPVLCVFGVIEGSRWVGFVKEDRADEQCNESYCV